MRTVRDMYRAGGMNEYEMSGMMREYAKSGKMPKALLEYFSKKKKEAERGMRVPEYQGSGFVPQIGFDLEKGVGDERFFDDPDARLQQKVDRGLASKAQRDSSRSTRDFNPVPTKDLLEMEKAALRERIRNYPEMVAADKFGASNIIKLDGEFVEQTPENERQMLLNRSATLEEFPNIQRSKLKDDFVTDLYEPATRENRQTYGPAKDLLISSTGFTRQELGGPMLSSSTLGTEGQSPAQQLARGNRAAQYLEDELREEAARMGDIYYERYKADAAKRAGKFQRGGRAPFRVLKRR